MATKTISLELEAYEKLRRAKKGGESFSAVVRRARFDNADAEPATTVNEPPAGYGALEGSAEKTREYWDRFDKKERVVVALESFDAASERQRARNRAWADGSGKITTSETGRTWSRDDLYEDRL
jgi:hypothetical protein